MFNPIFVNKPFSIAFLANSPAPIMTLGFDVFVQLVIAAINISPSLILPFDLSDFLSFSISFSEHLLHLIRVLYLEVSFGPDRQASTLLISKI